MAILGTTNPAVIPFLDSGAPVCGLGSQPGELRIELLFAAAAACRQWLPRREPRGALEVQPRRERLCSGKIPVAREPPAMSHSMRTLSQEQSILNHLL